MSTFFSYFISEAAAKKAAEEEAKETVAKKAEEVWERTLNFLDLEYNKAAILIDYINIEAKEDPKNKIYFDLQVLFVEEIVSTNFQQTISSKMMQEFQESMRAC